MKKRIGIDIDGVLRDFSSDLYNVIKEHYPDYIRLSNIIYDKFRILLRELYISHFDFF